MGLAGVKKRMKLSSDPNNNAWARSSNFGHKIMTSQGWKPGDYLGAENASHAEHYSAANASHIRVMLREDNLGLGAKIGGNSAETFGLATLSSIFGRLNGKTTEETQKQEGLLRDAQLRSYQAQKCGYMTFVSGGFLVGDKIQEKPDKTTSGKDMKTRKSLKRKIEDDVNETESKHKSPRKSKSAKEPPAAAASEDDNQDGESEIRREKKRKEKRKRQSTEDQIESDAPLPSTMSEKDAKRERKRLRAEKRARKAERRRLREEKSNATASSTSSATKAESDDGSDSSDSKDTSTPIAGPNTVATPPLFAGNRHAVRQRYIQQKRLASMNPQALKEILMLQAGA